MRSAGPIAGMALGGYLVDKDIDSIQTVARDRVGSVNKSQIIPDYCYEVRSYAKHAVKNIILVFN